MQILIVEDHLPTARCMQLYLESRHTVVTASTCKEAQQLLEQHRFDLLILDLGLPDGSGLTFCEKETTSHIPTLILSGRSDTKSKVTALDLGADDYLTKPFSSAKFLARINALLRRYASQAKQQVMTLGRLVLKERAAEYKGKTISLTQSEQHVLQQLARNAHQVVPKYQLAENIPALEVHIKNIRHKFDLPKTSRFLETIYGVGYRLNPNYD